MKIIKSEYGDPLLDCKGKKEVKLSLCLTKHYAMKTNGGVAV
jgi:hypothetical protein